MDGFNLTCVDYSQGMLDVFRSKLPNDYDAKILCQDVCELQIGEMFDLVMIPFNSITEITDKEKRQRAIQRVSEHLKPEGVFLCTLYNPEYRKKTADGNLKNLGKFDIEDNKTLIVSYYNNYSIGDSLLYGTQYYEIYGADNKLIEKRFMDIQCVLISEKEITEMCAAVGLTLEKIYDDYSFSPFTADSMFMNCVFVKR
jgi:ubiquinone/menaquinone biosynthesis C-methylase UbiE